MQIDFEYRRTIECHLNFYFDPDETEGWVEGRGYWDAYLFIDPTEKSISREVFWERDDYSLRDDIESLMNTGKKLYTFHLNIFFSFFFFRYSFEK